jgi:hypothetical protein
LTFLAASPPRARPKLHARRRMHARTPHARTYTHTHCQSLPLRLVPPPIACLCPCEPPDRLPLPPVAG